MLTDNQIVTGDSWGAVKDVLIVSPTFFFCFFFIIYLPSPFPSKSRSETEDADHKCLLQRGQACKVDCLSFEQTSPCSALVPLYHPVWQFLTTSLLIPKQPEQVSGQ